MTVAQSTCPLWKFPKFIATVDDAIHLCLENILNVKLENFQCPIGHGGIGIRRVNDISLPAFLGSSFGARNFVANILNHSDSEIYIHHLDEAMNIWQSLNSTSGFSKKLGQN